MEESTSQSKGVAFIRRMSREIFFFLMGVAIALFFFRGCTTGDVSERIVKTSDTIHTEKIIKIPEIKEVIVNHYPQPLKETPLGKDTVRTYSSIYTDSTGVAEVTVTDSVNGKLLKQGVGIKVKEREVKYVETVITNNTITKLKPNLVISGGLNATTGVRPTTGAEIGIKNKSGYNLEVGYNIHKEFTIGIKKDIFTFYKNNK